MKSLIDVYLYRLYVLFLFGTWALIGVWELNGLRLAFLIMTLVPIMEIGPMEQVIHIRTINANMQLRAIYVDLHP